MQQAFSQLENTLSAAIERCEIAGAVCTLSLGGEASLTKAVGHADLEESRPMTADTIFRIASMTKLIVSVATLSVIESGVLALDTVVREILPEFAPRTVNGAQPNITVRQLLTHTAGLGYALGESAEGAHRRLGISDGLDLNSVTSAENIRRIGQSVLLAEPSTQWRYSCATDVMGHVLEAVTGMSLVQVVAERVTSPLGMSQTTFHPCDRTKFASAYVQQGAKLTLLNDETAVPFFDGNIVYSPSRVFDPIAWPSGGVGMVGSAMDYLRLLEAIRTGGEPVVSRSSAQALTTNAIGKLSTISGPGFGWSFGASILLDPVQANIPGNAGSWGWGGVYGTHFFVDPQVELSWVCMTNTVLTGMAGPFPDALRRALYADLAGLQ